MADSDGPSLYQLLSRSGVLSVVASACAGILVPVVDRTLGATTRWCLILILCFAPGSPPLLLPLIKRDISLYTYIMVWHLGLFISPSIDRFVWMGTDDVFLNSVAILEWKLRAFFLPWLATRALSVFWAFRSIVIAIVVLLLGAWVLSSHLASSLPLGQIRINFLLRVVSACRFWITGEFSVRAALLRLHDHISMPLKRWEKDVARRRRGVAEATQRPADYVYRPLESPRHIRLLKLKRKSWLNPPRAELVHVCLDDLHQGPTETPAYEAISYTWGAKPPSIPLDVDGQRLLVTAAVEDLLFHRQSNFAPVFLWIDAICINQSSTAEKDMQLPLMREIYQSAQRTVVWLDTAGLYGAREAAATRRFFRTFGIYASLIGDHSRPAMLYLSENEGPAYRAAGRLLSHAWFRRMWVIQEVAVSKEIHVMACGVCMDWSTLASFVECVKSSGQLSRRLEYYMSPQASAYGDARVGLEVEGAEPPMFYMTLANASFMSMVRHRVLTGDLLPLAALITASHTFGSTDPRDTVFALLGIASDGQALPFKPEYGRPVADTFIDTQSYVLSSAGDRWSIHLACAGRGYYSVLTGEPPTNSALYTALPSWVPDYTASCVAGMRAPHPKLVSRINPSGTITVLNDKHRYPRPTLLLSAFPLGIVAHLTAPFPLLRHPVLVSSPAAINTNAGVFTHLSNANRTAREWYAAAVALALSHCSTNPEEEEYARQALFELVIDQHIAHDTVLAEEPAAPFLPPSAAASSSDDTTHPKPTTTTTPPPKPTPLYPFHSPQARHLFDQFMLSPLADYLRLTGPTATGDERVSTAACLHYLTLLNQTFLETVGGRRLAVLRSGGGDDGRNKLALVPPGTVEEDVLVLVDGAWSPFLFRLVGSPAGRGEILGGRVAELVGVCSLGGEEDGVMRAAEGLGGGDWEGWVLI